MSGFKLSWGGSWRNPANIRLARNGGWYAPSNIFVKSNGQWVKVWPTNMPLSMTLSHTEIYGYSPSTGTIYTENVTATPTGGTGSYTYTWTRISGLSTVHVSAGTSTVSFYSSFSSYGTRYATFRCTISDGVSSVYRDVYVEITSGQLG